MLPMSAMCYEGLVTNPYYIIPKKRRTFSYTRDNRLDVAENLFRIRSVSRPLKGFYGFKKALGRAVWFSFLGSECGGRGFICCVSGRGRLWSTCGERCERRGKVRGPSAKHDKNRKHHHESRKKHPRLLRKRVYFF